jgi:hypothetical protein
MSISHAYLALQQAAILRQLGRVERTLNALVRHEIITDAQEEDQMATVNDALQTIADGVAGLEQDVQRVLDALANAELTGEQQAAVDALRTRFETLNAQLDAAVPPAGEV